MALCFDKILKLRNCSVSSHPLLNDYSLTEADTYRYALESIAVEHPFEKVLLVSGRGAVDVLIDLAAARP